MASGGQIRGLEGSKWGRGPAQAPPGRPGRPGAGWRCPLSVASTVGSEEPSFPLAVGSLLALENTRTISRESTVVFCKGLSMSMLLTGGTWFLDDRERGIVPARR